MGAADQHQRDTIKRCGEGVSAQPKKLGTMACLVSCAGGSRTGAAVDQTQDQPQRNAHTHKGECDRVAKENQTMFIEITMAVGERRNHAS